MLYVSSESVPKPYSKPRDRDPLHRRPSPKVCFIHFLAEEAVASLRFAIVSAAGCIVVSPIPLCFSVRDRTPHPLRRPSVACRHEHDSLPLTPSRSRFVGRIAAKTEQPRVIAGNGLLVRDPRGVQPRRARLSSGDEQTRQVERHEHRLLGGAS